MWPEFNIKIHGIAGRQSEFPAKKAGKRPLFMKFAWNFKFNTSGHPALYTSNMK